jgi:hypothetical protein
LGQDTGNGTNPLKKSNDFNELQAAKSWSTPHIFGPREVIERELFTGRDWVLLVSPDGVVCAAASLRKRRLARLP